MVPLGVEGAIIGTALYVGNFTLDEALQAARTTTTESQRRMTTATGRHASAVARTPRPAPDGQLLDGRLRDLLAGQEDRA